MNDTEWVSLSKQSMQDACLNEISRNETVIQRALEAARNSSQPPNQDVSTQSPAAIEQIQMLEKLQELISDISKLCPKNCSGNGVCNNGTNAIALFKY